MERSPNTKYLLALPFIFANQKITEFLEEKSARQDRLGEDFIYFKIQGARFLLVAENSKLHGTEEDLLGLLESMGLGRDIHNT